MSRCRTAKKVNFTLYVKCPYCGMYNSCHISYAGSEFECGNWKVCGKKFKIPPLNKIKE